MKALSVSNWNALGQQTARFTLSRPVQASLYTSLCALILWTAYFSSYPAAHNNLHTVRHQTLLVGCH